jgi:hypothetical protein|tara:strand:- start:8450 stop:8926 length:477 start_codon:yes stop_codon:yes gene_type:complete
MNQYNQQRQKSGGAMFWNDRATGKQPQWRGDLELTQDDLRQLVTAIQNGQPAKLELGVWATNQDGTQKADRNGKPMMSISAKFDTYGQQQQQQQQYAPPPQQQPQQGQPPQQQPQQGQPQPQQGQPPQQQPGQYQQQGQPQQQPGGGVGSDLDDTIPF